MLIKQIHQNKTSTIIKNKHFRKYIKNFQKRPKLLNYISHQTVKLHSQQGNSLIKMIFRALFCRYYVPEYEFFFH